MKDVDKFVPDSVVTALKSGQIPVARRLSHRTIPLYQLPVIAHGARPIRLSYSVNSINPCGSSKRRMTERQKSQRDPLKAPFNLMARRSGK